MTSPRRGARIWVWSALGLAAWLLVAWILVPFLIEQAYYERSIGFLNDAIAGRSVHPLKRYTTEWLQLARSITFILATLGLGASAVISFRASLRRAETSGEAARPPDTDARAGIGTRLSDVILLALFFGLVAGLGEAWYAAGKAFFVHEVIAGFRWVSPHSIWMAPAANLALFVGVGLLLVALFLRLDRGRAFQASVFVFALLTTLLFLLLPGRVFTLAAVILALGIAYQLSNRARGNERAFRRAFRGSLGPLLAAWAIAAIGVGVWQRTTAPGQTASVPDTEQPSVLLIILDTVRAASLSLYGYERPTTPNLDRLAASGIVFDRAISTAPWTLPAHASVFTGRFDYELGTDWFTPLDDRYPTVAEVLSARGYATGGFVANILFCTEFFGLDRGFGRYTAQPLNIPMLFGSSWFVRTSLPPVLRLFGHHQMLVRKRAETVNREFLNWLDESGDRPFFAFLNYFDGHGPYLPPEPYNTLFWPEQPRYWLGNVHDEFTSEDVQQLRAAYDGAVAYLDAQVGSLLEELERRDRSRNTIVIVTSDHGESLSEHDLMGHARSVYLTELRVPLLVILPDSAYAGTTVSAPASLRNIPATIMELIGAEPLFPGYSLTSYWKGEPVRPGDYALSELQGRKSLARGDYHYWKDRNGNEELFDVTADPWEERNLIGTEEEITSAMRAELEQALRPNRAPGRSASP